MSEIYEMLIEMATKPLIYIPAIIAGAVLVTKAADKMNDLSAEAYITSLRTSDTHNLKLVSEGEPATLDTAVNE